MPPEYVDGLRELGFFGLAVLAVWAFYTDRIVPGKRHTEAMEGWKQSTTAVNRLADALEARNKGNS